jgi:hypothetical protein
MKTRGLPVLFLGLLFPSGASPRPVQETVRDELTAVYAEWAEARTAHDKEVFERLLAPDFWVQIGANKLDRQRFIDEISVTKAGSKLARFDPQILTLAQEQGVWVAVITEKLEFETTLPDGTTSKIYSLWVTKDRFQKDGERWTILSSEALGWENWANAKPPLPDWDS